MNIKIGDITKIKTGKLDANAATEKGKYPFFTCSQHALRISTYSYDCECVLVAGNGDLNVKYYNGKFDAYQRTYIIENNDDKVLYMPYLYYFMERYVDKLRNQAIGGVIKYIKLGNLTEAQVYLPSMYNQRKIVEELNKLKSIISQKREQLSELNSIIKARFIEVFGDMLLNSKSWREIRLDSVADIVSGITKGRKIKSAEIYEVPYMAVSNVKNGYIDWTKVKTIMATKEEIKRYQLLPNDVLMTEGGDPDKLGRGAIIKSPPNNCIHQNHIFRVRLNEEILPIYFEYYLQQIKAKRYFLKCSKQTTGIASINMKQLMALPVLIPDMESQKTFAKFTEQADKSKAVIEKSLKELETLQASLMQKYFS